jgi:sterol desaturase/sphingolipid hydroxylase (fatty acid hydroxylase superfamily)
MDTLKHSAAWLTSDGSTIWFAAFVGLFVVFGLIETLVPGVPHAPDRGRRWPTNFVLAAINISLVPIIPVSAVLAASWAEAHQIGILNMLGVPEWIAALCTLVVSSLAGYLVHVVMHKVPLLWRLHRVHHLDTHLDISTTLRHHPGELVVSVLVMVLVALAFGLSPWVVVLYEVTEGVVALISHANVRLPPRVDAMIRSVLVTPNIHSLHHSSFQPETDSNYGTVLTVWDRLFGTFTRAPLRGGETIQIGLEEVRDERASDLVWQIKSPRINTLAEQQ